MGSKYKIKTETEYDPDTGKTSFDVVKTFKHEQNALNFYNDPKNIMAFRGDMMLYRFDPDGIVYLYNDADQTWSAV